MTPASCHLALTNAASFAIAVSLHGSAGALARAVHAGFNSGGSIFMTDDRPRIFTSRLRSAAFLALAAAVLMVGGPSPALADRCDDLAAQLKGGIDGLTVGRTAANVIYLNHPAAKQVRLGCVSRNLTNEFYAASDSRKPPPAFLNFAATASAVVFTIPKSDTLAGVTRCIKRMGFLHGDDVKIRYRRLDMQCTRTKTSAAITISRGKDE
jgi:hypothetical protein